MTLYLTPDRYRIQGFGSKLEKFEGKDIELAAILNRASTLADAYCAVPLRPQRYSFLGGSVTGERHSWRLAQTPFEQTQRRLYVRSTPLRTVSSFRIYVTQPDPDVDDGQYVLVAPQDLMINRDMDYLEVVSSAMTSTGLFNALIVPAIYLAAPNAVVNYTYGYDFEVIDEPLYPVDGLTWASQNDFWTTATEAIKVGGVTLTTGYTVNRTTGTVTFAAAPALGSDVTASYHHKLPTEIRDAIGHITTHLIEDASMTARGLAELQSIEIAGQIKVTKGKPDTGSTEGARAYIAAYIPEAAILLDDFSFWRVA